MSLALLVFHVTVLLLALPPPRENRTRCSSGEAEGSSSVQTLGGMSGAIIVEDPEGSRPPEIEAMREVVMVLQETNIESGEEETTSFSFSSSERGGC